nr:hypothetical protein [Pandoravirus massiliensis]
MWPRQKSEPTASATHPDQGRRGTTDEQRPHNRYTFVRGTIDWREPGRYRVEHNKKRAADFERKEFCAVNRATASEARGSVSPVLLQACAQIWESDPVPIESLCYVKDSWHVGTPSQQQRECFSRIDAVLQHDETKADGPPKVWHMPFDEQTVDKARRHCGMPVGDFSKAAREMKDDLEIAIMCERNAKSGAPGGIKAAIAQFCQETKPDAESVIRRMAQEARAGDSTVTCLQNQLGLTPPRPS